MNFRIILFSIFVLCVSFGCASSHSNVATDSSATPQNTSNTQKSSDEQAASKIPIPPDSPFAKIREGMGQGQVMDILGPPKDQEAYTTGKQWIPFYFGSDVVRTVYYYKGLGQIHFNRGRVIEIMYDPKEDGYR